MDSTKEKLIILMMRMRYEPENNYDISNDIIKIFKKEYFHSDDPQRHIEYAKIIFGDFYFKETLTEEEIYLFKKFDRNFGTEYLCEKALELGCDELALFFLRNEYIIQDIGSITFQNLHTTLKFAYEIENVRFETLSSNVNFPKKENKALKYYNKISEKWKRGEFPPVILKPAR